METVKVNTSQHIDIDYPVAGLGERVSARLIDLGLFLAVLIVFALLFQMLGIFGGNGIVSYIPLIVYAVGFIFYDLLCEIFMDGQTFGKRWLKIKVISIDGAQPSLGQYFIRWVFRIVDFTLTQWLGALISVAVTENKQRIGDIVAGTTLIKTVPRTQFQNIAFHPVAEEYVPIFSNVSLMTDSDIELIHEVIGTYFKTQNPNLIYQMAERVSNHLGISKPVEMNELEFLKTIVMDYNQVTSKGI